MIKDEPYADYEDHHIQILSELNEDGNDEMEIPEDSKWDCLIMGAVVVGILLLGLFVYYLK